MKNERDSKEKTAVAKLRERFYEIKRSIKPSKELKELLQQKPKPPLKRSQSK